MASEALQNQVLLDQMFARSLAPINQALETQRVRVQQQQDWERNMAQREKELMLEQTFRAQQNREQLAAQAELAKRQQEAIDAREVAAENRAVARATLKDIDASPYLTDAEKEEAHKDPAKAQKYASEIVNRAVNEDLKSAKALASQAEETMRSAIYAMATEARRLPPDVIRKVNDSWLDKQTPKVKRALYPLVAGGGTLTPETVDKALRDARGMFGYGVLGLSDDDVMQASIQYRAALSEAAGTSKEANPEVQRLIAIYQGLQDRMKTLVATPTGRLAANKFAQEKQIESDALRKTYDEMAARESVAPVDTYPLQTPQGWESAGGVADIATPGTPVPQQVQPEQLGGILGAARNVAQATPNFLSSIGTGIYNTGNAVQDWSAGVVGGDYLRNKVQENRAAGEAATLEFLRGVQEQRAALNQANMNQPAWLTPRW
jgi:hypothetical protein